MGQRRDIKRAREQFEHSRALYNQTAGANPAGAARHLADMANAALVTGDPRHSREVNDITERAAGQASARIEERDRRRQRQGASWDTEAPGTGGAWVGGVKREPDADGTVRIDGEAVGGSGGGRRFTQPLDLVPDFDCCQGGAHNAGIMGDGVTVTNSAIGVNATVVNRADGTTEVYGGGNPSSDMEAGE